MIGLIINFGSIKDNSPLIWQNINPDQKLKYLQILLWVQKQVLSQGKFLPIMVYYSIPNKLNPLGLSNFATVFSGVKCDKAIQLALEKQFSITSDRTKEVSNNESYFADRMMAEGSNEESKSDVADQNFSTDLFQNNKSKKERIKKEADKKEQKQIDKE